MLSSKALTAWPLLCASGKWVLYPKSHQGTCSRIRDEVQYQAWKCLDSSLALWRIWHKHIYCSLCLCSILLSIFQNVIRTHAGPRLQCLCFDSWPKPLCHQSMLRWGCHHRQLRYNPSNLAYKSYCNSIQASTWLLYLVLNYINIFDNFLPNVKK